MDIHYSTGNTMSILPSILSYHLFSYIFLCLSLLLPLFYLLGKPKIIDFAVICCKHNMHCLLPCLSVQNLWAITIVHIMGLLSFGILIF